MLAGTFRLWLLAVGKGKLSNDGLFKLLGWLWWFVCPTFLTCFDGGGKAVAAVLRLSCLFLDPLPWALVAGVLADRGTPPPLSFPTPCSSPGGGVTWSTQGFSLRLIVLLCG